MMPSLASAPSPLPPPPSIPRRQVDFDFDPAAVPADWYLDDAFLSTFLDALSLLFPEGERFFVDSVKHYRDRITDPRLRADVVGFIAQEAMHGKGHRGFNELLPARGLTAAPRLEAGLRRLLGVGRKVFSPRAQLAITCALEHFTALLAEMLLRRDGVREHMHPTVRALWVWHALEESEHKAVAYDVYRTVGGGYLLRASIMVLTTAIFFAELGHVHARFLWARGLLFKPWRWVRGISHMWLRPGHLRRLIPGYFADLRPGSHPDDRDTTALLAAWREQLFGDGGELRSQLRAPGAA
jgi:predicted metal-dependent hydrolase